MNPMPEKVLIPSLSMTVLNDGADYAAAPIMLDEDKPLTSVARNTQLKVTGTIESKDVEVSPIFRVVVVNWDTVENPEISFD